MGSSTAWEQARDWALVRPFVYYQRDNFLPEGLVEGRDVIDFSAGLCDLSALVWSLGPRSLTATAPEEQAHRPESLPEGVEWIAGVGADRIDETFVGGSADVILARMVIQFPTVEDHAVDVDRILDQMRGVLRKGGTVVVTTHAFFEVPAFGPRHDNVEDHLAAVERQIEPLLGSESDFARGVAEETAGLVELVRYLGLPPREGPLGGTGFGLKIPMLVNSFVSRGFTVQAVEVIEPFTYPVGVIRRPAEDRSEVEQLGARVMAIKERYLTAPDASDPYQRPLVLEAMVDEIRGLVPVTAVPIVRLVATSG